MYTIAICDDEKEDLKKIYELLTEFIETRGIADCNIVQYDDGASLLSSELKFEFIFLDIQLSDANGISIAQKYLDMMDEQNIIFISNTDAYLKEGYRVKALRYITKPIEKTEFFYDLDTLFEKIKLDNLYVYDEAMKSLKIYVKDIRYIEVSGRDTYVYAKAEKRRFRRRMKTWEEEFQLCGFAKSHNSFLINLRYVYEIRSHFVLLKDKTEVPLSRTYKDTFSKAFYAFIGESL